MSDQRTRNRIKSLKVEEVSLVDRPANSAARFVLAKRDDVQKAHPADCDCRTCKESKKMKMKKSAEATEEVEITDEELDTLEAELVELESELDADEDEYDDDDEEDYEDDVVSEYEPEDEDEDEAASDELGKAYQPMVEALQESIASIIYDFSADAEGKKEALTKTISQFEAEAQRLLGEATTITKSHREEENSMETTQLEKRLTDLHDANVALEKRLADITEEREIEKRVGKARSILGKAASTDEVNRLATILKTASPEDAEFIEKMAKRSQELQKSARVFDEIGSLRGESVGASTAVEEMAKELQKNDPKLSRAKAITKAYEALGDEAYLGSDED